MRPPKNTSSRPFLAPVQPHVPSWTDLAVVPLVALLSVPPLVWFGYEWVVTQDAGRYLLGGWHLISGEGYTLLGGAPETKRGPVLPALLGFLMAFFGRDTESLAWGVRLLALANPLLGYFLIKRISGPVAGLIAAVLVTLLSYTAINPEAFNIDAVLLTVYLLSLLALLAAIQRDTPALALLSGLLLGAAIVTKETAFVNVPLALLAVLLFGWNLRGALWHYLGVAIVCFPWWAWVWFVSHQVYLVGRFPPGLQMPMLVGGLILVGLAAAAYLSGVIDRFLANERLRRWTGWFVLVAWTVSLSGFLLSTSGTALSYLSVSDLKTYAAERLAPHIAVWPLLLVAGGYTVWKTSRGGVWRLFAIALLFQIPICLLVSVQGWHQRQFLVPQTLLLCALAVLVTDGCGPLARAIRERRYSGWPKLVIAVSVVIYLVASTGVQTWNMLFKHSAEPSHGGRAAVQALEMTNWVAENVPEGEAIVITPLHTNYLAYLDGDRHRLSRLRLDQSGMQNPTKPRKRISEERRVSKNTVYSTPPDTVWLNLKPGGSACGAASLSVPKVVGQMKRRDIDLLMMTSYPTRPALLSSSLGLVESGAFEILHQEGEAAKDDGFALLKSTDRSPGDVPAWMGTSTVLQLKQCMQAKGPGYAKRMRSNFPDGIVLVPGSRGGRVYENPVANQDAEARQVIKQVYRGARWREKREFRRG